MQIPVQIIKIKKMADGQVDIDRAALKAVMPGNFDIKTGRDLSILLKTLISSGLAKIILDMSAVTRIDSSSIGILINIAKKSRLKGGDLVFLNVSGDVDSVFKMMHLNKYIKFCASEDDALKEFQV